VSDEESRFHREGEEEGCNRNGTNTPLVEVDQICDTEQKENEQQEYGDVRGGDPVEKGLERGGEQEQNASQ
jgi:hypothetical protein